MRPITPEQKRRAILYLSNKWTDKTVSQALHIELQQVRSIRKEIGLPSEAERRTSDSKAFEKIKNMKLDDYVFNSSYKSRTTNN